jgi:hypothetical protein
VLSQLVSFRVCSYGFAPNQENEIMGVTSGSKFVTDSGQFYDALYTTGIPQSVSSRFNVAEEASTVRRAQVKSIDLIINVKGETGKWVLWQGDDDISGTYFDHPDAVRDDTYKAVPLLGGVIPSDGLLQYTLTPSGLWIGREEKLVLCVNPTAGICEMYFSIHTLFMIGSS